MTASRVGAVPTELGAGPLSTGDRGGASGDGPAGAQKEVTRARWCTEPQGECAASSWASFFCEDFVVW